MSCDNNTIPLNINPSLVKKQCSSKCSLDANFGVGKATVYNGKNMVLIGYDAPNNNILFNKLKYSNSNIQIFSPSVNRYDGKYVDAEVLLTCNMTGMNQTSVLYIYIPIEVNNSNTAASKFFDNIVPMIPTASSNTGVPLNTNNFTPNDLLPKGQFFVYPANLDKNCLKAKPDKLSHIIIYKPNSSTNMSTSNYNTLKSIIKQSDLSKKKATLPDYKIMTTNQKQSELSGLFSSDLGSGSSESSTMKKTQDADGNDIYIKCDPVEGDDDNDDDDDGEETTASKETAKQRLEKLTKNPVFIIIVTAIIFMVFLYLLKKFFHWDLMGNFGKVFSNLGSKAKSGFVKAKDGVKAGVQRISKKVPSASTAASTAAPLASTTK